MLYDAGIEIPENLVSEALTIELLPACARFNLRIKSNDIAAFKKASGLKLPTKIGSTKKTGALIISKLGPDEWILSDSAENTKNHQSKLSKLAGKFTMSATDISHRNVAFRVSGPLAAQAINVGCPLDLSLESFPKGKVTRTIFENAPIQLFRVQDNEFHVECWRSFGPYMVDFWTAFGRDIA